MASGFMFATGVENSYPTIQNGNWRVDEMEKCGHYTKWRQDFDCVQDLGIRFLRYGPALHRAWLGDGRYDWRFVDEAFADLRRRGIMPITDLCHFGVPDWVGNFQNPDFPALFAHYAGAFARRFPWVQLYTPVNEMYICAQFSGRYGWWNEQMTSDQGFVTALKHLVRANVLAMQAILEARPDAIFVQSESSEYFHAMNPAAIGPAEAMNQQRFLSLDLNYGRRVDSGMFEFLMDNGMTRDEYQFFLDNHLRHHCVMGTDYYVTNEHRVAPDGGTAASGEIFGYSEITRQYHERYRMPVMHTETNLAGCPDGSEAVDWLHKEWANVMWVRNVGIPILGFTWYSITDQVDWDTALRENNGHVNAVGLFDLDRNIRPVGQAYKQLIQEWSSVLPTQSYCLVLPLDMPGDPDPDPKSERMRRHAVRTAMAAATSSQPA
jgi:beta-glucosidase